MEEWKSISYREDYEVSNFGNCRRKKSNGDYYYITPTIQRYKFLSFWSKKEKKYHKKTLHSLVAEAFLGERPEGLVIDHIDRDKLNNNVSNLRYITNQENICNSRVYRTDITETEPLQRRKEYMKPYNQEYREANKEYMREYSKKYRQENKEYMREYMKKYRQQKKEQS
jgi:transcriptional regulator of met regulon